jgi:hypothetical protein
VARYTCPKCSAVRSKGPKELCPVCWLVAELKREHLAGEHADRVNSSCINCTRSQRVPVKSGLTLSHDNCDHPRTTRDRAKCRAEFRKRNTTT